MQYVNIDGTLKRVTDIFVNIGGVLKRVEKVFVNIGGVLKLCYYGIDSITKSLLHFNGADESQTFTDETGKSWVVGGDAKIDTAQSKFGGASGYFDGVGDYIRTADHSDFALGSGDFTIDFWVYRNRKDTAETIFRQGDIDGTVAGTSVWIRFNVDNTIEALICDFSVYHMADSVGTIGNDSTWHHVAIVRNSSTLKLYIDGTNDGTKDATGITVNDSSDLVYIGRSGIITNQYYFNGWIDEFRFSNGIARWTGNFTPPTSEYV